MTRDEITSIKAKIKEYNDAQEKEALAEFRKGPVPKMKWIMERALECLFRCISDVESGKAPDGHLGSYMRDELARILATRAFMTYSGRSLDEDAAEDVTNYEEALSDCVFTEWTPEFGLWRKVAAALDIYLYSAAAFAKSVNAASTAARLYLRAWRIVRRILKRCGGYSYATQEEALAIVRLERVAADRLWVDAQFAALPPFKKVKQPRPAKAKKGKKAN